MKITQNEQKAKLPQGKGFYITLSICLIAIFAAGWSAYRNVREISEPSRGRNEAQEQLSKKNQGNLNHDSTNEGVSKNETTKESKPSYSSESSKVNMHKNNDLDNDIFENEDEKNDENIQSVLSDGTENLIIYPSNNNIIKEFSDGKPVYSKTLGDWRIHDGIDLKADKGSMVKSITSGIVKDIYNDPSYGMTIVIQHSPGFVAYYSGLGNTTLVKKDDKVKPGDDIGSINDVPIEISEEPHLHLMINQDGKFIDPMLILEKDSE